MAGTLGWICVMLVAFGGDDRADVQAGRQPGASGPGHAEEERAIRASAEAYSKAFNARDAKALAALWTPDGALVDEEGREFLGRAAIEGAFAEAFAPGEGLAIEIEIDSIRFLGPDVALERGVARVRPSAGGPASSSRYSVVHVKRDGHWLMESVHESPSLPSSGREGLRELDWMIGEWTAEVGGARLEVRCEWALAERFIKRTFTLKEGEKVARSGIQIIGWDPRPGRLTSWQFESDGGFGHDLWTREGRRWSIEATGVLADGRESSATNIIVREDDGTFTWRSVQRTLDGVDLPDTAEVKVSKKGPGE